MKEFIVAGDDTPEVLETGKKVFDTVALSLEVLIEGRFMCSAGVAVEALVHEDERARA